MLIRLKLPKRHTLRRFMEGAQVIIGAALVANCRGADATLPIERHFAPALSRIAVPTASQHVFVLQGGVSADFVSRVASHGGQVVNSMPGIGVVVTTGLSDADASVIAGSDSVARDQIGRWVPTPEEMGVEPDNHVVAGNGAGGSSPLDATFLSSQWDMFQIHATEAWAATSGSPNVRVAILDSGLDPDHVDQQGLIDIANSVALVPSTAGPPAWADDNLHGTFVGGIVTSNNIGTVGVVPNVRLIAVKVIDASGSGTVGSLIAGIYYATNVGAQVINLSLGLLLPRNADGASRLILALRRAMDYANRHGVLIVSAAGNDATDLQHSQLVELPCQIGEQLCVSATGAGDSFEAYSNYGENAINVAAPGGDPLAPIHGLCSSHSSNPRLAFCDDGRHYIFAFGTSAAAPHVSGLAAYLDSQLSAPVETSRLITLIQQHADKIAPGAGAYFGTGRINVANTLAAEVP